jgi:MFS transporter, SP family, arabinose:H+ symporter
LIAPRGRRSAASRTGSSPALLTTFFPKMVTAFAPGSVFLFFCGMMVLQLLWVKTMVPETKGVPLEQMQRRLGISPEPA